MNKAELIAAMAAKTGETKKAAEASLNAFVEAVTEALEKQLDFNISRLETTAKYRAYEVAYGKYKNYDTDFGELAEKYMGYINKPESISLIRDTLDKRQKIYDFLSNPNGFSELKKAYENLTSKMEVFESQNNAKDLVSEFNYLSAEYKKYKAENGQNGSGNRCFRKIWRRPIY